MSCAFKTDQVERPNLDWRPAIDLQRDELRDKVPASMQQIVVIGHSNGGLVSRSYAQWAQQHQPGRVKGVITLDSPNQGAIFARNGRTMKYVMLWVVAPLGMAVDHYLWQPVFDDDVPGSWFLSKTNNFPESFTRVGVQTHTPKRWVFWRLGTPSHCMPESDCGERAVARQTQESYDRARHYSKFWYRPWQSIPYGIKMMAMNATDATWNGLTAPFGRTSDGLIHGEGQVYPNAHRNYLIPNGDSHVGTTRSPLVQTELLRALGDPVVFNLTPRGQ